MITSFRAVLALLALLALTACESPEEKAERFYQSGLTLLEAGDVERALVEFRNVFEYDGFHKEARITYAQVQLERGLFSEAYAQYLRLIEQYPDEVEARMILAEIAVLRGDWPEVRRHGDAAFALTPDAPRARALRAAVDYRAAVADLDKIGAAQAVINARAVIDEDPNNITARRIVIDALGKSSEPAKALPHVDAALAADPSSLEFHVLKLRLLADDEDAAVAQLRLMFDLFPDNEEVRSSLVAWYLGRSDYDAAEDLLRQLAGDIKGPTGPHVTVVQFLQTAHGEQAARAKLDGLIAANAGTENADLYQAMIAVFDFDQGNHPEAITALRAITTDQEPTVQNQRIRIMLARMLDTLGDRAGAAEEVAAILDTDISHVPALKLRATWLIEADDPDAAITDLRAALNQSPRDAEILTLMAEAHTRGGSSELAGERLALAVNVSGSEPDAALRYVQFLLQDNRRQAAESVLVEAHRAHPTDLEIISRLADFWLQDQNWASARTLLADLRRLSGDQAANVAITLEAEILMGEGQADQSLAILQEQLADMGDQARATVTVVLAQIRSGKTDEARSYLDSALIAAPDDITLQILSGSLHMMTGNADAAEDTFAVVLNADPANETANRLLYTVLFQQDRLDEATRVLDAGITANADAATLRWIKAGMLERAGDIDAAIAIYEELYTLNSGDVIVANNLASLIATHRDDAASLDRAFTIARRLRGMDIPAFQDTYGWIAARRGDHAEALSYLRPAALGLSGDPLVQFHLGMTYAALDRKTAARETLALALELAGDSDLPQFEVARAKLAELGVQ
jgi:tetratricopeptide (TPR) repeat protein